MRALGRGRAEHHDLGVVAERAAEAQLEVHRHADHQRHVGALEAGAARAREEQRMVGGHAAARQAVEEDRHPQLVAEPQQGLLPRAQYRPVPAITTGRCAPRSSAAARSSAPESAAGAASGSGDAAGVSRSATTMNTWSSWSMNAGPLGGVAATRRASSTRPGLAVVPAVCELRHGRDERHVIDLLQRALTPAKRGRSSAQRQHGRPVLLRRSHRAHAARDPWPGRKARYPHTSRVALAQPSAAKAADRSWRTSTMSMPSSRQPS